MVNLELPDGKIFIYNLRRDVGEVMHSHHCHDRKFEIYYMVSGKCSYFVDDKPYEVISGDVVLIPAGAIHRTDYGKDEHTRILIECSIDFVPEELQNKISEFYYVYRNPAISRDIMSILKKIEEEYKTADEFTPAALHAYMRLFFNLLVRNSKTAENINAKNAMIEDIVSEIKEHFSSDITLTKMAKSHFVSSEHLSRTFKHETGFGFNEYLTLVRLRQAEQMLKERGNRSISEIAYSCGFNDSNYFSDKFRRAYGLSPLKFSKQYK